VVTILGLVTASIDPPLVPSAKNPNIEKITNNHCSDGQINVSYGMF